MSDNYWNQRGHRGREGVRAWLQSPESAEAIYRSTFNLQTHIDIREIALLDMYLNKLGLSPRTMSELAKMTIQLVTNVALGDSTLTPPETAEEALHYLRGIGYSLGQFTQGGRQSRRIAVALQRESLLEQGPSTQRQVSNRPEDIVDTLEYDAYDCWMDKIAQEMQEAEPHLPKEQVGYRAYLELDKVRASADPELHIAVHQYFFQKRGRMAESALVKAKEVVSRLKLPLIVITQVAEEPEPADTCEDSAILLEKARQRDIEAQEEKRKMKEFFEKQKQQRGESNE